MELEVKDVKKHFRDNRRGVFAAVNNVSFSCSPGEVFGLLGPNGAGKTTILNMISSLLIPDEGTIAVHGFNTVKQPELVRQNIGFLPAESGLYERLTAREV